MCMQGHEALVALVVRHLPVDADQMRHELGGDLHAHEQLAIGLGHRVEVVAARSARLDRAEAGERDIGGARKVEDLLDRRHAGQHVPLRTVLGKKRRVDQDRLAAEPFGHARHEMVHIGVDLALHPAGERHDGDVERLLGRQGLDDRAHRLAPGDRASWSCGDRWRPRYQDRSADDVLPCADSLCMISKRVCASRSVSAAVGSSRIRTLQSSVSALAISTSC